jgi:hypothetical protein
MVLLFGLLVLMVVLRKTIEWPSPESERVMLVGVFVMSLTPVALLLIDLIVERGAVLEYAGVKLDFSRIASQGPPSIPVPVNIGVPGHPVSDSDTTEILDALRQAVDADAVIVDLEEGHAWWETRLLVLLAGATRRGRPSVVVFVATDGLVSRRFQGWAPSHSLLDRLLQSDHRYRNSYYRALAAARQWELVEPQPQGGAPPPLVWATGLAASDAWMAFDAASGLPNRFSFEQFLAADLGRSIEIPERPMGITLVRLGELFRPVLRTEQVEESWPADEQTQAVLQGTAPYVAVTLNGSYVRLLPRIDGLSAIVRALTGVSA